MIWFNKLRTNDGMNQWYLYILCSYEIGQYIHCEPSLVSQWKSLIIFNIIRSGRSDDRFMVQLFFLYFGNKIVTPQIDKNSLSALHTGSSLIRCLFVTIANSYPANVIFKKTWSFFWISSFFVQPSFLVTNLNLWWIILFLQSENHFFRFVYIYSAAAAAVATADI